MQLLSIAKSLGSLSVSQQSLDYYNDASPRILNEMVSDKQTVEACCNFSGDICIVLRLIFQIATHEKKFVENIMAVIEQCLL